MLVRLYSWDFKVKGTIQFFVYFGTAGNAAALLKHGLIDA